MPKVYLTDDQRKKAAESREIEKFYRRISDGLATKMNREKLTRQQIGSQLGITRQLVSRLLNSDDLQIDARTMLKVMRLAGLEVKQKEAP